MTYEFAKYVADNLRFGSYNDRKQIRFENIQNVVVGDVNSNTYISFFVMKSDHWKRVKNKWYSRPEHIKIEEGLRVNVYTGILSDAEICTDTSFTINTDHPDYKFWKEFKTFIEAAYEDKVYKHNCVIEDAFVV